VITRRLGGSPLTAALAALFLACDPMSVQWSIHVRPYAILQLLTLLIAWRFLYVLAPADGTPDRKELLTIVVLVSAAVFTHVGALKLLPAIAIATCWRFRNDLRQWLRVTIYLSTCLCAPIVLLMLNRHFDVSSAAASDVGNSVPIIGNHLINIRGLLEPQIAAWLGFYKIPLIRFIVPVLTMAGTLLIVREARRGNSEAQFSSLALFLLTLFWVPALVVVFFTDGISRYLIHIHSFELIIIALGAYFATRQFKPEQLGHRLAPIVVVVFAAMLCAGTTWRFYHSTVNANFLTALRIVESQHQPGEPIVVSWPPIAWDTLTSARDDLIFLAGSAKTERATRYTKPDDEGVRRDFWAGMPSITSTAELCDLLRAKPNAWLVLDPRRLNSDVYYGGDMAKVIRSTSTRSEGIDWVKIWRPIPQDRWPAKAERICARAAKRAIKQAALN